MRAFKRINTAMLAAGVAAAMAAPAAELAPKATLADVVKASAAADWRPLDPNNTLYMELPAGRVVIELAPAFAPQHVANIRTLVRERYFDGLAVIRAQDNWVVQWGDPDEQNPRPLNSAKATLKGEFTVALKNDTQFTRLPDRDGYAPQVGLSNGFPSARDPKSGRAWLTHCYGMVGVGRDNGADSANGSSLYVVIGQAPRQLDRNITVVGRAVAGMPLLSTMARGAGPMCFYDKPEQNVPIASVKLAADVPPAQRSKLEVMRTETATTARRSKRSATAAGRGPRSPPATSTCATPRSPCANKISYQNRDRPGLEEPGSDLALTPALRSRTGVRPSSDPGVEFAQDIIAA